jgi:DMSO/TMAO reductase YedYZ molybdopterin-dependent catalytic subunit
MAPPDDPRDTEKQPAPPVSPTPQDQAEAMADDHPVAPAEAAVSATPEAATSPTPAAEAPATIKDAQQPPPDAPIAAALPAHTFAHMTRREVLKLTPLALAGAFAVPRLRDGLLTRGVALSDWASGKLFRTSQLAPTFSDSLVVPFERFPYNGYDVIDPEVDLDNWTLTVEGAVSRPGEYKLEQVQALPRISQNTRHVCVEGWDVIGNFGGARVSDFLKLAGADESARYLEVECADDYFESLDMQSALHPQSLLCYEMYGKPLDRGHGAPLRLQMPTKLGYKQAKYLTKLRVTSVLKPQRGYWEDQGYSWFGGL